MFSKTDVFCDGLMLGVVTENILYFRVDEWKSDRFQRSRVILRLSTTRSRVRS
jgi:DNA transformation protein and related proteins